MSRPRRLLFDHNVPRPLARRLKGYTIRTAEHEGWGTLRNGDLLSIAEKTAFDVLLTADQGIPHQNRLAGLRIGVLVLSTNNWPEIRPHIGLVQTALDDLSPGQQRQLVLPQLRLRRRIWSPSG